MGGMQSLWAAGLILRYAGPSILGTATWRPRYAQAHHRPLVHPRDTGPPVLRRSARQAHSEDLFCKRTRAGLGDYCCPPSGIWRCGTTSLVPSASGRCRARPTVMCRASRTMDLIEEPRATGIGDCRMPENAFVVQNRRGYNSWPMIQAMGAKLVCTYSRDNAFRRMAIRPIRAAAIPMRRSPDGGRTWSAEVTWRAIRNR